MTPIPPGAAPAAAAAPPAEPIVAVATAPGRGAVGILRVSSARPLDAFAEALLGRLPPARSAWVGAIRDADGEPIDHGLVLHFPAPRSYTGESVLELQAHGGPVVLQLLLARCLQAAAEPGPDGRPRLPGLRLARPGEFTERAFLAGKLDLAQAEAVADLIDAGTEAAARGAARSLQGAFSDAVHREREAIEQLRLLVEATLDFPEEDIDFVRAADVAGRLDALLAGLQALLGRARQGVLLRDGLRVVLAGQPNVGKSSLLNALAGAELAIVTPVPGTTRDRVRETVVVHGIPLHVTDTAGLRDTDDPVERLGIARSWQAAADADLLLVVHDLSLAGDARQQADDARIEAELAGHCPRARWLHVDNKCDLAGAAPGIAAAVSTGDRSVAGGPRRIAVSARTGAGLDALRDALAEAAGWAPGGEGAIVARERHLQALRETLAHLGGARTLLDDPAPPLDLLAEELRLAHRALATITGAFTTEDLLGAIFGRFCIGK